MLDLGSPTEDPKRHHLSPKDEQTLGEASVLHSSALPFIYFRAAREEASSIFSGTTEAHQERTDFDSPVSTSV